MTEEESVKKLEAIIKPFKLEEVKEALTKEGIEGMTEILLDKYVVCRSTSTSWRLRGHPLPELPDHT